LPKIDTKLAAAANHEIGTIGQVVIVTAWAMPEPERWRARLAMPLGELALPGAAKKSLAGRAVTGPQSDPATAPR